MINDNNDIVSINNKLELLIKKISRNNTNIIQETLISRLKTYNNFYSLSFTVFSGTANITIGDDIEEFPKKGDITLYGSSISFDEKIKTDIEIDATLGSVLVTLIT